MDALDRINKTGRCCCCNAPLTSSRYCTLVNLAKQADWQTLAWRNVFFPERPRGAVAVVCDGCVDHAEAIGFFDPPILCAIEVDGPHIIYHALDTLRDLEPVKSYHIGHGADGTPWIHCLRCGLYSHHPEDVAQKYCANCHMFHEGTLCAL